MCDRGGRVGDLEGIACVGGAGCMLDGQRVKCVVVCVCLSVE